MNDIQQTNLPSEPLLTEIRRKLAEGNLELPSLPKVVQRIWETVEKPDVSLSQIAEVVRVDPGLSARLLRFANSAYYRGGRPIADIDRAVVRLGLRVVKNLLTAVAIDQFYTDQERGPMKTYLAGIWNQSVLVAATSETLAEYAPGREPEVAMLAGLLHRIGALPILEYLNSNLDMANNQDLVDGLLSEIETEVGSAVLEWWDFPAELVGVIKKYPDLQYDHGGLIEYIDLVQVAVLMSHRNSPHPWASVAWGEVPAVRSLGIPEDDIDRLMEKSKDRAGQLKNALSGAH